MQNCRNLCTVLFFITALLTTSCGSNDGASCGSTSTTTVTNPLSDAMPTLAIASPTESSSCSSGTLLTEPQASRRKNRFGVYTASLVSEGFVNFVRWVGMKTFAATKLQAGDSAPEIKPINEMVNDIKSTLDSDPTSAATSLNFAPQPVAPSCYGPALTYTPDGSGARTLPSGDLGLFGESESDGTACSAAQLNYLVAKLDFANAAVKAVAVMLAAANSGGFSLPAIGDSVDVTAEMPELGTGGTVSSASLARLSNNGDGQPIYRTRIQFAIGTRTDGKIAVYHTPTSDDNSTFKGYLRTLLPHDQPSSSTGFKAATVVYNQDSDGLRLLLDSSFNQGSASNDFFEAFGSGGKVGYSGSEAGSQQNHHKILASFNPSTNEGTMHFAWQAGSGDGAIRSFSVNVSRSGSLLSGVGYFGFGSAMSSISNSGAPWITGFFPDWTTGLSGGAHLTTNQGQTFAQTSGGGKFSSTAFRGLFVPTSTGTGSGTISGNTTFNGTRSVTSLDFVSLGDLGTVGGITVPTYTLPEDPSF